MATISFPNYSGGTKNCKVLTHFKYQRAHFTTSFHSEPMCGPDFKTRNNGLSYLQARID